MSMPALFKGRLSIPVIGAPLFIISVPDLVIAQCKAGVVGSFPALNARPASMLDEWLHRITEELAIWDRDHPNTPSAPFAVNHIVHKTSDRLMHDVEATTKWKVPIVITSLGAREDVNAAIHSYGGVVLHDVINNKFARKAVEKGADGLIPVAAGAGGHAGGLSPFALVQELREWFDGPIALSGAIANGREGHLVLRPGHRRDQGHPHRRRAGRPAGRRIRGRQVRTGGQDRAHPRRRPGHGGGVGASYRLFLRNRAASAARLALSVSVS